MGQYRYKYKSSSAIETVKEAIRNKNRQLSIASVVILLLLFSFIFTSNLTGYLAYKKSLESELNATKLMLAAKQEELSEMTAIKNICENDLQNRDAELVSCNDRLRENATYLMECEIERDSLRSYSEELNALLVSCEADKETVSKNYEDLSTSYNELVKKTVVDICCRPGIETSVWNISENRIVCSGAFTVDCSSGETTY